MEYINTCISILFCDTTMAFGFKDEEEVKEYLKNLGIEYRFQCFHEKDPGGCHRLGDYLEAIKKDFSKASKVYKNNCDEHKYGKSCYKYGNYSFLGKGIPENQDEAFEYYKKGCANGCAQACFHSGLMLTVKDGWKGHKRDYVRGLEFLEKGCELNDGMSCYYASGMYISGNSGVPKDMKRAFEVSKKACELGNVYACANVSQMYGKGDGVEKNEELANKYKLIAQDLQEQIKNNNVTLEFEKTS